MEFNDALVTHSLNSYFNSTFLELKNRIKILRNIRYWKFGIFTNHRKRCHDLMSKCTLRFIFCQKVIIEEFTVFYCDTSRLPWMITYPILLGLPFWFQIWSSTEVWIGGVYFLKSVNMLLYSFSVIMLLELGTINLGRPQDVCDFYSPLLLVCN